MKIKKIRNKCMHIITIFLLVTLIVLMKLDICTMHIAMMIANINKYKKKKKIKLLLYL